MFIGSIRNPMQKFGDGPFFFFDPLKLSFSQLGYQTVFIVIFIFLLPEWIHELRAQSHNDEIVLMLIGNKTRGKKLYQAIKNRN